MSDATNAFGTLLKLGDGQGSETFTTIAEVLDISGPEISADTEEVTNHSSTGGWKEFLPTLLSAGEVTFDVNWLPGHATHSNAAGLLKDLRTKAKRNFQIVFPAASPVTWSFAAYVTKMGPAAPVSGPLRSSITLTVTGQPTLA